MDIIRHNKQKAIKEHKCDWCGLVIPIGEQYENSFIANEGEHYTWKNHISCSKIASHLKMFDGVWNEGLTGEDFQENINEEYNQIISQKYSEEDCDVLEYTKFSDKFKLVKEFYLNNTPL